MNLIAIVPAGASEVIVNGLYQWDYGRKLEIQSPDLPATVEVHFACMGMQEAIVRTCSAVSGTAIAAIPDLCLEQNAPIIAWVYAINGTTGATVKTITLPITPRPRPQAEPSIPRETSDAYTEFLSEINRAIKDLKDGAVTVAHALASDNATNANHSNDTDAVLSKDALQEAGHLDNLVKAGRYYCDWSAGTPTGGYGNVEVFRRFENTMQVFYSWSTGETYIRKTSKPGETDKEWTEWKSTAKYSKFSSMLEFDEDDATSHSISQPGLYLLYVLTPEDDLTSEFIFIPELDSKVYTSSGGGAYYGGSTRIIQPLIGYTIKNIFQLGTYSERKG